MRHGPESELLSGALYAWNCVGSLASVDGASYKDFDHDPFALLTYFLVVCPTLEDLLAWLVPMGKVTSASPLISMLPEAGLYF